MTTELNTEHLLQRWLVDGVNEMPDRVYLSILDRVEREPQRRAWRASWRNSHVNTYLKPIVAIAAVLVVAIAGFALLSPPSNSGVGGKAASPSPLATASPAPSVAGSLTPPAAWPVFDTRHPAPSPLPAGIHSSINFRPVVGFELTSDWVHYGDYPGVFMISPDTAANRALEAAGKIPSHIDMYSGPITVIPDLPLAGPPTDVTACAWDRPDAPPVTGREETMDATAFVDHLAAQDGFAKTGPIPVTVDGLTGQQITLVPEAGWTICLPSTGIAEAYTADTEAYRYVVLDTPDGGTLEFLLFAPADFDAFIAEAMPVVESFQFELRPEASPS